MAYRHLFPWSLAASAILCVGASRGSGAEYFVGETGRDEHNGRSPEQAWRTIQHAVTQARPGDSVTVLPGVYAGARIEGSGTSNRPIRLQASARGPVVLDRPSPQCRHQSVLEFETWKEPGLVSDWIVSGFEVAHSPRYGVDLRNTRRITVQSNLVHHSAVTGIFTAFSDDARIEGNESHHNGEHGVYCSNSGDRPVVRGNRLHANQACGVHMNGDLSAGGDGTITGARIEGNVIFENGRGGGSGINLDGVHDSLIANNVLYDNHASGISLFKGNGAACSSGNRVLHNTVLVPADGRWALNIPDGGCVSNRVVNNLLLTAHARRGSICLGDARPPGFASSHNAGTAVFTTRDGLNRLDLEEWRVLGYAEGSFAATAGELFAAPERFDFRLKPGSPAIKAGVALEEVPADAAGRPRGAAPDLGAYEFVPTGP
jgi:parallel beta-helix repeat protein